MTQGQAHYQFNFASMPRTNFYFYQICIPSMHGRRRRPWELATGRFNNPGNQGQGQWKTVTPYGPTPPCTRMGVRWEG